MTDRVERIKACLNGGRTKDGHPSVPAALGQVSPARGCLRIMVEIIGWTAAASPPLGP
jgi:hypothetical protein